MKRLSGINALPVALPLLLLMLIAAGGVWLVTDKHRFAQSKLQELEPRYSRLMGLKVSGEELDQSIEQANKLLAHYVYPSTQDTSQVGNAAQQKLRDAFTASGVDVVSSQILPAKLIKPFERVAINVRIEGQLIGFQSAMIALAALTPTVWVDGYTIQTMGNVTANMPQRLSISLNLYVLRTMQ